MSNSRSRGTSDTVGTTASEGGKMPELPEVETVKRTLAGTIVGKRIDRFVFLYDRALKTDKDALLSITAFAPIVGLHRRGKYLLFVFADGSHMVLHLRMEGKLFFFMDKKEAQRHDTLLLFFEDGSTLHFNDVRKFGCLWFYKPGEELSCLEGLGKEANQLTPEDVREGLRKKKGLPWKEFFLDQTIFAGIGNIYADEICFALGFNPFAPHKTVLPEEEMKRICETAKKVLNDAIVHKGTTVKTFLSSQFTKGENQHLLKVYGREGKKCDVCGSKIMKRDLGGRGTSYCPRCQHVPYVLGITGGIASGKSTLASFLLEKTSAQDIDCDKLVKKMYADPKVLARLSTACPQAFENGRLLGKSKRTSFLIHDKKGRRKFLTCLYSLLKQRINRLLNENPTTPFLLEAPLLFEARLQSLCTNILMMETSKTEEHLVERGEKDLQKKKALGATNKWKEHVKDCDAIVSSDGSLEELKKKAEDLIKDFDLDRTYK